MKFQKFRQSHFWYIKCVTRQKQVAFQHADNLLLPCRWCPAQLCCASILLKLLVPVASCPDSYSLLYLSAAVVKHYTKERKIKL